LVETGIEEDAGLQELKKPVIDLDELDCGPPEDENCPVTGADTENPAVCVSFGD
jgi:hypothetical protein